MNNRLTNLNLGQSAVIDSFSEPALSVKLMEMGCLPGETIRLHKYAPLGDPLLIEVSGYFLSLRKNEAETIVISRSQQ